MIHFDNVYFRQQRHYSFAPLITDVNRNNVYLVKLCKRTITGHVSEIMITFVPQKHTDNDTRNTHRRLQLLSPGRTNR